VGETGTRLIKALRDAGFSCDEVIVVKPTEEDLRRMRETIAFVRKVDEAHEAAKNSTLHLG
jgi:pyrroline-5-carboxylate reductase